MKSELPILLSWYQTIFAIAMGAIAAKIRMDNLESSMLPRIVTPFEGALQMSIMIEGFIYGFMVFGAAILMIWFIEAIKQGKTR